jgi:ABC-type oligopeptide transport system substrate-binding subunit
MADRNEDELWKRSLDAVGIRIGFLKQKWPELNKMTEAGQLQMWGLSWVSSIPDGDSFVSPLYSRNIGTSNDARLRLPEYDALYERSRTLPDGPERYALFRRMTELVVAWAPWARRLPTPTSSRSRLKDTNASFCASCDTTTSPGDQYFALQP